MNFDHIALLQYLQDTKVPNDEKQAHLAEAARQDLGIFLFAIMDFKDIDAPYLDEFIKRIEEERDRDLFLLPRFHFKTSIFSVGASIWSIIRDPERRIGIGSWSLSKAKDFVREIKLTCEQKPILAAYYPEVFYDNPGKESPKWTENELVFKHEGIYKEASITAFTLESLPTGLHFDDIRVDDAVVPENVTTKEMMDKVKNAFKLLRPILSPQGVLRVAGTIYDFGDLHRDLEKNSEWRTYKRHAIEDGKPILPSKFTVEKLAEIRREVGPYIYSCQYDLDPIDPETALFRKRNIQYFDTWRPGSYRTIITVDLAFSEKRTSDYTVILHTKTDSFRNLYVSDYIRGHLAMDNFLNALFDMAAHVQGLTAVGVEILPSESEQNSAIIHVIREEMRKRSQFFTLTAIKPHRDKVTRTQSLQALYSNGMVFIRKEHVELEDELLRFPKGEHDDLVDALAYAAGIMQEPRRRPVQQPEPSEPLIGY